jgi:hypothetical protein
MKKINNLSGLALKLKELEEDESFKSLTDSDIVRKFIPEKHDKVVNLIPTLFEREDLPLEQQITRILGNLLIYDISMKYDLSNDCYEKRVHDELKHLLNDQKISQKDFDHKVKPFRDLFIHFFQYDLTNQFAPVFPGINEYIAGITAQLETKYSFIESINPVRLGNIFKYYHLLSIGFSPESINDQIKNLTLLGEYLANPDGFLNAPILKEPIEALKNEYLDETMMDFYGLDDFEYVQFLIMNLQTSLEIFDLSSLCQSLDESLILKEKRKKSVAALLYDLCLIAQNQENPSRLPTYEQWYAEKQLTNEMDDKRTWKLFQTRQMKNLFPNAKILS